MSADYVHRWLDSMKAESARPTKPANPFVEKRVDQPDFRRYDLFLGEEMVAYVVDNRAFKWNYVHIELNLDVRDTRSDLQKGVIDWIRENVNLVSAYRHEELLPLKVSIFLPNEESPVEYINWFSNSLNQRGGYRIKPLGEQKNDNIFPGYIWCEWELS